MNKYKLTAFLTALILLCMIPFPPLHVSATTGKLGDDITFTISKGVLTLSGTGKTYSYSNITDSPLCGDRQVYKTIIIEEGITEIGDYTRLGRWETVSVSFPDSLTRIGKNAFRHFQGEYLDLPPHLEYIGESAFEDATNLKELVIPDSVTEIGKYAFSFAGNNSGLTSLVLPDHDIRLGAGAFNSCGCLETVHLPENLTVIPDNLFLSCRELKTVNIPPHVTGIGNRAFCATSLIEIDIPGSVKTIGVEAFLNSSLKKITLHEGLEAIRGECFAYCCPAELHIPDTVTEIGEKSLPNTIETLTLPQHQNLKLAENSLPEKWLRRQEGFLILGDGILYQYRDYKPPDEIVVPDGVKVIYPDAFTFQTPASVILPESVTELRCHAFSDCAVKSVCIPEATELIADEAFYLCSELEWVAGELYSAAHEYAAMTETAFKPLHDVQPAPAPAVDPETDVLSILNNGNFFGETYSMEPAAEQVLLANAVDSSQMQQKIHNPWNGSCFGLSTVSVLVRDGVLPLSLLDPEAETLHDVRMTAQAESIFNYYQNTQYAKRYLTHSGNTKIGTQYGVLCLAAQYAADFNSSGRPFVVTFLTARGTLHAVVGNGLETGDWTLNDRSYDRRIRIWDSNYSGMNDNCCIYFNHLTLDYLIPQYSIGPHARGDSYAGALSSTECDAALLNEYPYPEEAVSGDLNGDRKRNTADAVLLARYVAEDPVPLTVFPVLSAADLNTDGVIDLRDVFALLRML